MKIEYRLLSVRPLKVKYAISNSQLAIKKIKNEMSKYDKTMKLSIEYCLLRIEC